MNEHDEHYAIYLTDGSQEVVYVDQNDRPFHSTAEAQLFIDSEGGPAEGASMSIVRLVPVA